MTANRAALEEVIQARIVQQIPSLKDRIKVHYKPEERHLYTIHATPNQEEALLHIYITRPFDHEDFKSSLDRAGSMCQEILGRRTSA